MILYSLPELKYLANSVCERLGSVQAIQQGKSKFERFANGELHARIYEQVRGRDCAIIGAFTPPDEQLLKSLILAHTLKKEGANKVVAILPYLAYARHDKNEQYKSLITGWIGEISGESGLNKIITIDIHSKTAESLMKIPVISISPVELFLAQINKDDLINATIVAPDEGAKERAEIFRKAAGIPRPIAYFKKTRRKTEIARTKMLGETSNEAIIVDDILDTGGTLVSCAEQLKKRGVKKITVIVTHGLFTGKKWSQLFKLNVKKIITTDSTPASLRVKNKEIEIISCAPVLAEIIKQDIS